MSTTVTVPAGGRRLLITFGTGYIVNAATFPNDAIITIWDGAVGTGTRLGQAAVTIEGNSHGVTVPCSASVTPAAGSKTYSVGAQTTAGNATGSASATAPQYVLVTVI